MSAVGPSRAKQSCFAQKTAAGFFENINFLFLNENIEFISSRIRVCIGLLFNGLSQDCQAKQFPEYNSIRLSRLQCRPKQFYFVVFGKMIPAVFFGRCRNVFFRQQCLTHSIKIEPCTPVSVNVCNGG